jgi:hypothetical protein
VPCYPLTLIHLWRVQDDCYSANKQYPTRAGEQYFGAVLRRVVVVPISDHCSDATAVPCLRHGIGSGSSLSDEQPEKKDIFFSS